MIISSSDCEFLEAFDRAGSLAELSRELNLDKGFTSRKLTKIASSAPVLTKVLGKWMLTQQGQELVKWYKAAKESQKIILTGKSELIIGTTQLVSERRLIPQGHLILKSTGHKKFKILTSFGALDAALLPSKVDCIISCDIPHHPEIRFKKLFSSPFVLVRPSSWRGEIKSLEELFKRPYVSHSDIEVRELLKMEEAVSNPIATFDHLVGVREAVSAGLGWAILPEYAVERELTSRKLIEITEVTLARS